VCCSLLQYVLQCALQCDMVTYCIQYRVQGSAGGADAAVTQSQCVSGVPGSFADAAVSLSFGTGGGGVAEPREP